MLQSKLYFVFFSFFFLGISSAEYNIPKESNMMCGPNTLWLTARSFGIETTLKELRYFSEAKADKGTSLKGMLKALKTIGLDPVVIQTDWKGIKKLKSPTIALFNNNSDIGHYVFVRKIEHNSAFILDPPYNFRLTEKDFNKHFYGFVIVPSKKMLKMNIFFSTDIHITTVIFFIVFACLFIYIIKSKINPSFPK